MADEKTEARRLWLRETIKHMDPRWPKWIVEAAATHFAELVEKHQARIDTLRSPSCPSTVVDPQFLHEESREEALDNATARWNRNRDLLRFTLQLRDELERMNLQKFAAGVAAGWKTRR